MIHKRSITFRSFSTKNKIQPRENNLRVGRYICLKIKPLNSPGLTDTNIIKNQNLFTVITVTTETQLKHDETS